MRLSDEAMKDLAKLKAILTQIVNDPKLQPIKDADGKIVETHCNFGAICVANEMGCHELDGLNADAQYKVMDDNASGLWLKVPGESAALFALVGGLAFAAMTSEMLEEQHGHIAAVSPEPMQFSGSLNKEVPMVCNIGKEDKDEKESQAFPVAEGEAIYFVWNG